MPMASPLTTVTPAWPSTAPISWASASPCGVAARVPTTATRGALEVGSRDVGHAVEVGEGPRDPADAGSAPTGEQARVDEGPPRVVGVRSERQEPVDRPGRDVGVAPPRPVGVARLLAGRRRD